MEAIKNDIERRAKDLERYNYTDTKRLATIELLDQLAQSIDFVQRQVNHAYKAIEYYNNQFGMRATTKLRYDSWQIKKATLTRLQTRYKKVLTILNDTI
jgi:cytochrome c peroxidase